MFLNILFRKRRTRKYGCFIVKGNEKESWNAFVIKNGGSIFHLWEWGDIVQESLNYKKIFLVSIDKNDKINGILPLFLTKTNSEKRLASPLYTGYLDALAKNHLVKRSLYKFAYNVAKKEKAKLMTYTSEKTRQLPLGLFQNPSGLCDFLLETDRTYESFFMRLGRRKRERIRQIRRAGLKIERVDKRNLGHFYNMHVGMMKRLGFPPLPKLVYDLAFDNFIKYSFFLKSISGKETGAYIWSFIFNNKIYIWRIAYQRKLSKLGVYDILLENTIKKACKNKYIKEVDIGVAACNSGLAIFKERWGFEPRKIYLISSYSPR